MNIDITATRPLEFLPSHIKNAIKMLTLFPNYPSKVVGSFRFQVHEHPSDIDLLEVVNKSFTSLQEAKNNFVTAIQNVVKNVRDTKGIYLGDFKAGIDHRYKVDFGSFHASTSGGLVLVGYDPVALRKQIEDIRPSLFKTGEKKEWLDMVVNNPTYFEHKKLVAMIRKRLVLRWKIKELVQGEKHLPGKKVIKLADAIFQNEIVKIDIYVFIGNRFIEMTDFYFLQPKIKGKEVKLLEYWDQNEYKQRLLTDIETFKIPELHKHMKVAKRMWNLANFDKDEALAQQLYPLFNSPVSKMAQVVSDIETMLLMCEKLSNPPTKYMLRCLNDALLRIGTIPRELLPLSEMKVIYEKINGLTYGSSIKNVREVFEDVHETLNKIVDSDAKAFLKQNGIL